MQRKKIEDKAWDDIDQIKEKNKEELAVEIKFGMESKAALMTKTGEYKNKKQEKEDKSGDIQQKKLHLEALVARAKDLTNMIAGQQAELAERDNTIRDKDSRIFDLKKKTQELEKFKFVLDYKIKELKRDIGPREDEIKDLLQLTSTMQQEVQHFNRVNQNLSLIVEDLKMR